MDRVIRPGRECKLLLLSATPINNRLDDLGAQMLMMNGGDDGAYGGEGGIGVASIRRTLADAQKGYQEWERLPVEGRPAVDQFLGEETLHLIEHASIARSRAHIERYYGDDMGRIGRFPDHLPRISLNPELATDGAARYADLLKAIAAIGLHTYDPGRFASGAASNRGGRTALVEMQLVKRLESSVVAFRRTLERMRTTCFARLRWCEGEPAENVWDDHLDDESLDEADDEWDERLRTGKREWRRGEIDTKSYAKAIRKDLDGLQGLEEAVAGVEVHNDRKLAELRRLVRERVEAGERVLVFTAYADTAGYLYEALREAAEGWKAAPVAGVGLVHGSGAECTGGPPTAGTVRSDILRRFAPVAQRWTPGRPESADLAVLVATDCLSEGQNLQDARHVVSYDVHWNPVTLVQRAGRIDRLNTPHESIQEVVFWPALPVDEYLGLRRKVLDKQALGGAANAMGERRERALKRLLEGEGRLVLEDVAEGASLTDMGFAEFMAELLRYFKEHRKELEEAPDGLAAAVVAAERSPLKGGAVFCLCESSDAGAPRSSMIAPYHVVAAAPDGRAVHQAFTSRQGIATMRDLAAGKAEPLNEIEDAIDSRTNGRRVMDRWKEPLRGAMRRATEIRTEAARRNRQESLIRPDERYRLVAWLLVE